MIELSAMRLIIFWLGGPGQDKGNADLQSHSYRLILRRHPVYHVRPGRPRDLS